MSIACGVYDNPVERAESRLQLVDDGALVVGLKTLYLSAALFSPFKKTFFKFGKGFRAVNVRFPYAEQIDIRSVHD